MTDTDIQILDEIIPDTTARVVLRGAMEKSFPGEREKIEQHLRAFGVAMARCSRVELDTKFLQRYFLKICGWNEFQAIWFRSRIEQFIEVARTNRKLENLGE